MPTRILIIDDDEDLRALLRLTLVVHGFEVTEAASGAEGLAQLEAGDHAAVVLDFMMPGMSGFEVLARIRETRQLHELPVLMLTGRAESQETVEALEAGANDYLVKPCDFEIVVAKLKKELRVVEAARPKTSPRLRPLKRQRTGTIRGHFCPTCQSVLSAADPECQSCHARPTPNGWPALDPEGPWPWLGKVVEGRYVAERFLGAGAFSQVYRVRDLDLDRRFAMKVVDLGSPMFQDLDDARAMIAAEVASLAAVDSPQVVRLYELFDLGETHVGLLMDYATGQNLADLLRLTGALEVREALIVVRQVAQGLAEAHRHGIVHRDIKPANILVSSQSGGDLHASVLDFGLAKRTTDVTRNVRTGTATYMAPEQVMGGVTGVRADVYGLGCVLMEMLTGAPPYTGSESEVYVHHVHAQAPALRDRAPDVPERLSELVAAMLAKEPGDRPRSMVDVVTRLDEVLDALGPPSRRAPTFRGAPFPFPAQVQSAAILSNERAVVATQGAALRLVLMRLTDGERHTVEAPGVPPTSAIATDDTGCFVAAVGGSTISIVSVPSRSLMRSFEVPSSDCVTAVALGSGAASILWGTAAGFVHSRNMRGDVATLRRGGPTITSLACLVGGAHLHGCASGAIRRVDANGRVPWEVRLPSAPIHLAVSARGDACVLFTAGGLVYELDPTSGRCRPGVELEAEVLAVGCSGVPLVLTRDSTGLHLVALERSQPVSR